MRNLTLLFIFLLVLGTAAVGAFFLQRFIQGGDLGSVIFSYGQWTRQITLLTMMVLLCATIIVSYIALRLLGSVVRLPGRLKRKVVERKTVRSQQALIDGVIDSAEGNFEKAEKTLIRHAANSGMPLMHYLTAARAAQSRGAFEHRDHYLKLAQESTSGSEFAVGLARAELHLSEKQFDEALESLGHLNSIAPAHASILKLLHQTYAALEDWESIRELIPSLHKNKTLMEAEIKLLETETYSSLLKKRAEQGDADELRSLWQSIPQHIQDFSGVHAVYFAGMIEAGVGAEVEEAVRKRLKKEWTDTLIVLYGCIELEDQAKQLKHAENWLKDHPQDAILLRVLGKLSLRLKDWEKAEKYLGGSIGSEPSVEAYRLLGDMLAEQGDKDRANECFRRGLMLASEQVIRGVGQSSQGHDDDGGQAGASEPSDGDTARSVKTKGWKIGTLFR